ncbi:MAG: hypothetical protein AAF383_02075 [Cyanobacteria bacterium P01_A01_bin.83]
MISGIVGILAIVASVGGLLLDNLYTKITLWSFQDGTVTIWKPYLSQISTIHVVFRV